jgi:transposase
MQEGHLLMTQADRDRLVTLRKTKKGLIPRRQAAEELGLSIRQVKRQVKALRKRGDKAVVHGLRGKPSNQRIAKTVEEEAIRILSADVYKGFRPTFASECLADKHGIEASKETVRQWMIRAKLWRAKEQKVKAVHVWRPRRDRFGELVQWDTSEHDWLEGRGEKLYLIAMIDDATSRLFARFVRHDTSEENMKLLWCYIEKFGRPQAFYTDKAAIFQTAEKRKRDEPGAGKDRVEMPPTQIGRALQELGIVWIAAHSPQAKGRIERLFATLQDRLVKEMRLAGIDSIAAANHFLETRFIPQWEERFTVAPRNPRNAHRLLDAKQRLEEILSVRVARQVAEDHTVSWDGTRWGVPREEVCAGLRGAQVEIERRLDGSHWLRFRGRYLRLAHCPAPRRPSANPFGLRPPGLAEPISKPKTKIKSKYHVPPHHPWKRKPWKRTFLLGRKPDISTLR